MLSPALYKKPLLKLFDPLLNEAPVMALLIDKVGKIADQNKMAGNEFNGIYFYDPFPPGEKPRIKNFIRNGFMRAAYPKLETYLGAKKYELTTSQVLIGGTKLLLILLTNVSQSEEKLRLALGSGLIGTWEIDFESNQMTWTIGLEVAFRGDLQNYLDTIDSVDRAKISDLLAKIKAGKLKLLGYEYRVKSPNGEHHWVESHGKVISDTEGKLKLSGIWVNITKRKFAQERLETQHKLTEYLSSSYDLAQSAPKIVEIIATGLGWDYGALRIDDLIVASWGADKNSNTTTQIPINFRKETSAVIELKSKEIKVVGKEVKKLFTILGHLLGQFFQRVAARQELAESKDQLELILKNLTEGIIVQDTTGKRVFTNASAAAIFDFTNQEDFLVCRPEHFIKNFEFFNWDGKKIGFYELPSRMAIVTGKETAMVLRCHNLIKGTEKWLLFKSRPIFSAPGKLDLVVSILEDISEQIASQNQRELFLGVAGHELKTPIMSIKAFAQLSKRKPKGQYLEKIDDQANRLTRIVNEILDVNRIRAGKFEFRKANVDLNMLLSNTLSALRPVYQGHKIGVKFVKRVYVFGDYDRLAQVINNLVINAIKYSPEKDKVEITMDLTQDKVTICVTDFGIGIPKENLKHIFNSYYRVRNSRANNIDGLGLGLYIAASIVKGHEGEMWVESKEGKGSSFYFSLPVIKLPT